MTLTDRQMDRWIDIYTEENIILPFRLWKNGLEASFSPYSSSSIAVGCRLSIVPVNDNTPPRFRDQFVLMQSVREKHRTQSLIIYG